MHPRCHMQVLGLLLLMGTVLFVHPHSACAAGAPDAMPNLLIILADDMGYGDLSCYGSKQLETPNIDALAADGVRCTNGYVSGTVCSPSRAGLMTGRYQSRFGHEHNIVGAKEYFVQDQIGLPISEVTMADRLKQLGYRTACIGKWHLGGGAHFHPNARGFDYYFGRYKGHGYFPKVKDKQMYRQREPVSKIDVPYTTDWYTVEALNFIDNVPEGEPWFVYLAHDTPHTPLQAKQEDLDRFAHIKDKKRRTMLAMQHCLDENVGKLVQHLKDTGQYDNTLIVFFSDNGGIVDGTSQSINAPLRGQKSIFFDGGMHVPFIFTWPDGKLPKGTTYTEPFIALDLLPTFLAAAGSPWQIKDGKLDGKIYDGVDLLPYLKGERGDEHPHDTMYWRITHRGAAMRDGDWKLIRTTHATPQLYDLSKDVSEVNDLAGEQPQRVRELMIKLAEWEESLEDTPRWFSGNYWKKKNRMLYYQDYPLTQPE